MNGGEGGAGQGSSRYLVHVIQKSGVFIEDFLLEGGECMRHCGMRC